MKIEENTSSIIDGKASVRVTHLSESLHFNLSSQFKKAVDPKNAARFDLFHQINSYWAKLPLADQTEIFNIYKKINNIYYSSFSRDNKFQEINNLCVALLDAHDFNRVRDWVSLKSDIIIPRNNFLTEYVESYDNPGSSEKTYLLTHYVDLVTMSLILRTMVPVWGEQLFNIGTDKNSNFREFYAFKLINGSKLQHCPAYEKLRIFIDHTLSKDKINLNSVFDGVSSEDHPYWLLSLIMIRRLCIGDIRGTEGKGNLVTVIHKFITTSTKESDGNPEHNIKFKKLDKGGSDGRDSLSSIEMFKLRSDKSPGAIVELRNTVADVYDATYYIEPDIDKKLIDLSIRNTSVLKEDIFPEVQKLLMGWVLAPRVSHKAVHYFDSRALANCAAITQAVLWHRGFYYLAALITARVIEDDIFQTTGSSFGKDDKVLIERLNELFPHKRVSNKKDGSSEPNMVVEDVKDIAVALTHENWFITLDDSQLPKLQEYTTTRRLPIISATRNQLLALAIDLAERRQKLYNI